MITSSAPAQGVDLACAKLPPNRRHAFSWLGPLLILPVGLMAMLWCAASAEAGWQMVFEDNFDGSSLDLSKWYTRFIYNQGTLDHLNDEQQRYRDGGHHVVQDGILQLIATKPYNDGRKAPYESGMIRSKQTFRYGYFEARVKLPKGKGLWPAFWLNSDFDEHGRLAWPPEIDIFEYAPNGAEEKPNMIHANVAVAKTTRAEDGTVSYADPEFNQRWNYYKAPFDLTDDWHTFGLLWTADSATMYLDGKKMLTKRYLWVYKDGSPAGPAHILLNLAVGGKWAGKTGVDDSALPAALQVDYVRVCQQSQTSSDTLCGGSKFTPQQ